MTPILLLALLAVMLIVLGLLVTGIYRKIKARQSTSRDSAAASEGQADLVRDRGDPVAAAMLQPRTAGRRRQLLPQSEGGADATAADRLLDHGHYANCESKLEQAFALYSQGRISLDTYDVMVKAEAEGAKRLRSQLRALELATNNSPEEIDKLREEIEMIEIAVQWCLDWSADLRSNVAAKPGQA